MFAEFLQDLMKKLVDKPYILVKVTDPVTALTSLHVAAAINNVEVLKSLLEWQHWQGENKIELEAENMYGETALHMAAMNGCNETANLLLKHGAFVDAKDNNGMTPLHLAVRSLKRGDEFSIVETLLDYSASCSAKDYVGMVPLDYLASPRNEDLWELLSRHLEEQRKRRAFDASCVMDAKMNEFEAALSNVVGLDDLKEELRIWFKELLVDVKWQALGDKNVLLNPPHVAFLGNPNTRREKTNMARILGKLLYSIGIISIDKVIEVERSDLIGDFIETTPIELIESTTTRTRRKIEEAEGGILFVNEACSLLPYSYEGEDAAFGIEALEEIISVIDSGEVMFIFAGSGVPMKKLLFMNDGFCRRITGAFIFDRFRFTSHESSHMIGLQMEGPDNDDPFYDIDFLRGLAHEKGILAYKRKWGI